MISLSIKPQNMKKIRERFKAYKNTDVLLLEVLDKAAIDIQREAKTTIQSVSQGKKRYVTIPGRKKPILHTVSKPGDAPNTLSGRGVKSVVITSTSKFSRTVGSRVPYMAWLEEGIRADLRRPWLRPAFKKFVNDRLFKLLKSTVKFKLPKGGK